MRMLVNARNRAVAIEGERIVAAEGRFDIVLDCPDAEVRPGLINAHDHLHRNHYGRLGRPGYRNAYQWAHDIQTRYRRRIAHGRGRPRREALLAGAWKNLFAGVTSVVHHDAWEDAFDRDFPIRVVPLASVDSLGMTPDLDGVGEGERFGLHLAEGVDEAAADEVRTIAAKGLLTRDLIAVHGVGMDPDGVTRFRASGAALVWCPSSNLFLFGRTAPAALLDDGIDVLLGSDSLLTGAGDLLDELAFARAIGGLSDARLEGAVGAVAAVRLGLDAPALDPGGRADLVLLRRPLVEARATDVLLVVANGAVRVACPDLAPRLGIHADHGTEMTIGTVVRWTSARTPEPTSGRY
jgi:cytosine/adenosine deaminase-related metal-dependent hydrolase